MGIFSFLGKKDRRDDDDAVKGADVPRRRRDDQSDRAENAARAERLVNSQIVQRDVARKTALKIDAIESEMSSELARPAPAQRGVSNSKLMRGHAERSLGTSNGTSGNTVPTADNFSATLPVIGMTTDFLLDAEAVTHIDKPAVPETPAIIEEVAILFANDQNDLVESMLQEAISDASLSNTIRTAWWMLFDLYQIQGNQVEFENLALSYASKFETSPPTWLAPQTDDETAPATRAELNSVVIFSGTLDASVQKQIDRAHKLSNSSPSLRFEFARVTEASAEGCVLLLDALKKLQQSGCTLTLAGGNELLKCIRSIIEVGRRDEIEAPWLLLLETLQLMNRQQDFEESSIDYCVTYEVSPPAFVAPKTNVTAAIDEHFAPAIPDNVLLMPTVLDVKSDQVNTIITFTRQHQLAILDCSQLDRVDFSAASQLLGGLAPLAGETRIIELHNVNHLVSALFNVMGMAEVARIFPRKQ